MLVEENNLLDQVFHLILHNVVIGERVEAQFIRDTVIVDQHGVRSCNIPIIIVSAKNSDSDKILGLDLGADDYVVKPFNTLELVSRVNSNLRRFYDFNDNKGRESEILKVGELELDTNNLILKKNKNEIELTPTEYKIVSLLMKKPGRVFTKVQIYENVKGEYFEADDNTIMVHISKIREKIEEDSHNPKYIKTVRGLGYKIENIK